MKTHKMPESIIDEQMKQFEYRVKLPYLDESDESAELVSGTCEVYFDDFLLARNSGFQHNDVFATIDFIRNIARAELERLENYRIHCRNRHEEDTKECVNG